MSRTGELQKSIISSLGARDGCRRGRRGTSVLQESCLGAAGSERRDRPGIPGVLPQIRAASMTEAAATPAHRAPQHEQVTRSSRRVAPDKARKRRTGQPASYRLTLVPLSGRTHPPRHGGVTVPVPWAVSSRHLDPRITQVGTEARSGMGGQVAEEDPQHERRRRPRRQHGVGRARGADPGVPGLPHRRCRQSAHVVSVPPGLVRTPGRRSLRERRAGRRSRRRA